MNLVLTWRFPGIGGSTTLSVTDNAWGRGGDGTSLILRVDDALFSIDRYPTLNRTRSNTVFQ